MSCLAPRVGGIVSAIGLDPDAHRLFLQGAVSVRMFSLADDEVNMLRTTTALLGGAIGGADQLSAHAHDCLGGSSAAGRRLARMQQHLLREESSLACSLDAAGGWIYWSSFRPASRGCMAPLSEN